MKVEHWDEKAQGPLTDAALRRRLEERGYSVSRHVHPPGTRFPPHTHAVDKIDAVLSGRLRITMGGRSVTLEAGGQVHVPRGREHAAEVVGDDCVVSLDAIRSGASGG